VSESNVEALTADISDQAQHRRKFSYQEELRELLKRHRVLSTNVFSGNNARHSDALSGRFSRGRLPLGCSVFALWAMRNVQTAGRPERAQERISPQT
jgi:hypothetical protein